MKKKKFNSSLFFKIILFIILYVFSFGFLLPYLFSAKSIELVIFGIIYLIIIIWIFIKLTFNNVKGIKKWLKNLF